MVKEYTASELLTDTSLPWREHDAFSHAKKVTVTGAVSGIDPSDPKRNLKPTSVVIGAAGVAGFNLDPDSKYRYIATDDTNIALASESGYVIPDVADLFAPGAVQFIINTGTRWRRLEVFSAPGATAQLVKIG